MSHVVITSQIVHHIALLSQLTVDETELQKFADGFTKTLDVAAALQQLDVTQVLPTFQVTGLSNVWREDVVDTERMFSQSAALQNAPHQEDGYFLVPQVIEQE